MENVTLDVQGMTCGHCVQAVTKALNEVGVNDVAVHLETGKVDVSFDKEKVTVEQMKEAIEDQGYDVV
ncbi:copper chaperone [Pullulanibacillus pueri]|uniref:Copper chaperone CopZ n=1 Tax=Pullulanibacillus pueri TaxID=1437324 RepID=A0A8J2ZWM5_9BACL|nr:copper chaperone CopZ [Pullulanibacillus pueri]MBM7680622.1 copper chaperone [Pullulanibacillus pueri]GGH83911.1 copper chaperone CopZ [Pullulanibacillus pueri]